MAKKKTPKAKAPAKKPVKAKPAPKARVQTKSASKMKAQSSAAAEAAQAEISALRAQLEAAMADLDVVRADRAHITEEALAQKEELERLRAESLKQAVGSSESGQKLIQLELQVASARREAEAAKRDVETARRELSAAKAELGSYKLRCPKCGKNFVEEQYEGITIDRCTGCDAVYFDAGEVDQLLLKWQEKEAHPSADPGEKAGWWAGLFRRKKPAAADGTPPPENGQS